MSPFTFLFGLIITGMGVVFLGVNYGWWSTAVWEMLASLWPLLLILLGLRFIIRNNAAFLFLSIGIIIATSVLASTTPLFSRRNHVDDSSNRWWPTWSSGETADFKESQSATASDTLSIDLGGRYDVVLTGADTSDITIELKGPKEIIETLNLDKQNETITLRESRLTGLSFFDWTGQSVTGTITLPKSIALDMDISGLSELQIRNFEGVLSYEGAGATTITFENSTVRNANIDVSGAGKVQLDHCEGEADFTISGAGEITAKQCDLQHLRIDTSGGSKVDIKQGTIVDLDLDTSGASTVKLSRPSGKNRQSTSGASKIDYY